jgi:hypothetical protein
MSIRSTSAVPAALSQVNRFSYSFDRETFQGDFATREQAVAAGFKAADELGGAVEAVYVGKKQPVNPMADHHAEDVVRGMRRRMLEKTGEANYLAGANEHVLADLDASIEASIVDWLARHQLAPAPKLTALSEHPLPTVPAHAADTRRDEVKLIGPEE